MCANHLGGERRDGCFTTKGKELEKEKHRMRSGKGIRGFVVGHCALVLSRGPEVVSQRHRLCSSLQHGIQLISQVIEHAADVI